MIRMSFMKKSFPEFTAQRRALLIVILCLFHLIPVWGFKFIPTHDGLSHLYNAYILTQWNNPKLTKFHEVYELNLKLPPNWSSHAFFFVMLHIFPPLIAEKIYVTVCVLLFPASLYYFLNAIDQRLHIFGMLGFLYSYNFLLHMGFYNFVLSAPLCLIGIGYYWKHKSDFQIKHGAVLNLLLILTYFSHFGSYTLLLFSLSFLACIYFLDLVETVLDKRHEASMESSTYMPQSLSKFLYFVGYLTPSYFILLNTPLTYSESGKAVYRHFLELVKYFVNVRSLVYFNDSYLPVSWVFLGLIGFCAFWTMVERVRRKRMFEVNNAFLLLALILTVLFFRLPAFYGGSAGWINDRVHFFIFPILLGWFIVPEHLWVKRALITTMLLILSWHLSLTIIDYKKLNEDIREFTSGVHLIEPNSTLSILNPSDDHSVEWAPYYGLMSGSHYVGNYEPQYVVFPLRYKDGNWKFKYAGGAIDYMLAWDVDDPSEQLKELKEDYQILYQTKRLKIFQHRWQLRESAS